MNPRRLIVNADDYGRSAAVSTGIRRAHREGIVTSTTVMLNMPDVEADLRLALEETPRLGLGVHLTLTAGRPLSVPERVGSLVDEDGKFRSLEAFIRRLDEINPDEVRLEWRLQAERFVACTGCAPTHFDSHHHVSYFTPALFRLMLELARDYRCAIRYGLLPAGPADAQGIPAERLTETRQAARALLAEFGTPHPGAFIASFYDRTATHEHLLALIRDLPEGVSELMCHPGYADENLRASSSYCLQREDELALLTNPDVMAGLQRAGVELVSFGTLGG